MIVRETAHFDFRWRKEAVPARDVAAPNARILKRDNLTIERTQNAMERAHPSRAAGCPSHGFRPGHLLQGCRNELGQNIFGRPPGAPQDGNIKFSLGVGLFYTLIER